ncbi:MAG TPA: gephyrin-like molybdotransferase Glp [Candidatus Anoxymicrobiaceae bacterium]
MAADFLRLIHLPEAVRMLLESVPGPVGEVEVKNIEEALGRVAASDVLSPEELPGFDRSSMDGYAVRAADTFGASEGSPAYLELTGEVMMGSASDVPVGTGQALRISTGGVMPDGADAVVMVENTEMSGGTVEVVKGVAPGENTIGRDEDVAAGSLLLKKGQALGPAQLGALAGVGLTEVGVYRRPVVAILSTGDEVVPPETRPRAGQVRDINSIALAASVVRAGCEASERGIVADDFDGLLGAARAALADADVLLISGGSSAGVRDMTLDVLNALGKPGVLAHGIYFKPGKPTLIAVCDGKLALGLPGNPASALAVFREVLSPALMKLRGESPGPASFAPRTVEAVMERSVASAPGRLELVPVALKETEDGYLASPILGKPNLIGTLVRAQGHVRVGEGVEGLEQGQRVVIEMME